MIKAGAFVEITQSDCSLSDNFVSKRIPFSHGWNLPASSPGSAWTPEELAGGVRGNTAPGAGTLRARGSKLVQAPTLSLPPRLLLYLSTGGRGLLGAVRASQGACFAWWR